MGTSQRARITHVNYSTNTLTVDKNLTWTQNQGISLAYAGSAPDLGAYEYQSEPTAVLLNKPNGGESWNRNSQRVITWNAIGCQGNLKITLWQNGGPIGTIADGVNPAAGSYSWVVGTYSGGVAPLGNGYTIKIEDNGSTLADESNAPFSIVKISVKAPNGGETWQIGSTQNITWVTKSISGQLRIVLFKNGVKVGNIVRQH